LVEGVALRWTIFYRFGFADNFRMPTIQPDVIGDPCTLYGARRSVIEYLARTETTLAILQPFRRHFPLRMQK